jgi:hypothetical protein
MASTSTTPKGPTTSFELTVFRESGSRTSWPRRSDVKFGVVPGGFEDAVDLNDLLDDGIPEGIPEHVDAAPR